MWGFVPHSAAPNFTPVQSATPTNSPPLPLVTKHIYLYHSCVTKGKIKSELYQREPEEDLWMSRNLPRHVRVSSHEKEDFDDKFGGFGQKCDYLDC